MGIRARNEQEKELLKQKIKQAAIELIIQAGYEQLSMRKIAAKIEYSPTTIYLYYQNKAEIIRDMEEELFLSVMEEAGKVLTEKPGASPDVLARECMLVFIRCFAGQAEMVKAVFYSGSNRIFGTDEDRQGAPANEGIHLIDMLFLQGIDAGVFREQIRDQSWMLISALLGFVMAVVEHRIYEQELFEERIGNFVDILLKGVCKGRESL